ncbi:LysM peptidoglycan-binding domain-containing protein [Gottfriedia solisilvae]|uniref:LysM peptidoglycan-binding domain-containing protein n=1 Tax=Gottfriedia solisilvae TaxID=1516104 RepID=UPI003D2F351C
MSRKDREETQIGGLKRKNKSKKGIDETPTVDMLNLPPRSKSIQKKEDERRPWWKIKYPLITALVFLFILLPIGVVALVQYKYDGIFSNKSSLFIPSNKFEKVKITSTPENNQLEEEQTTKNESQKPPETNEDKNQQLPVPDESVGVKEIKHVVQEGETLFTISMKYYKNRNGEEIIQDENNLKDIEVTPGQVLKIPLNVDLNK